MFYNLTWDSVKYAEIDNQTIFSNKTITIIFMRLCLYSSQWSFLWN